jgi:hypothetical protein
MTGKPSLCGARAHGMCLLVTSCAKLKKSVVSPFIFELNE